jgi:hypothetical protein
VKAFRLCVTKNYYKVYFVVKRSIKVFLPIPEEARRCIYHVWLARIRTATVASAAYWVVSFMGVLYVSKRLTIAPKRSSPTIDITLLTLRHQLALSYAAFSIRAVSRAIMFSRSRWLVRVSNMKSG